MAWVGGRGGAADVVGLPLNLGGLPNWEQGDFLLSGEFTDRAPDDFVVVDHEWEAIGSHPVDHLHDHDQFTLPECRIEIGIVGSSGGTADSIKVV